MNTNYTSFGTKNTQTLTWAFCVFKQQRARPNNVENDDASPSEQNDAVDVPEGYAQIFRARNDNCPDSNEDTISFPKTLYSLFWAFHEKKLSY